MSRRTSLADCMLLNRIQQLNRTMAANAVAEAGRAERRAEDHRHAMEQQADGHVRDWAAYIAVGRVDPEHLERLSGVIVSAAQDAAAAVTAFNQAHDDTETQSRGLERASANLKQAEALANSTSRQISRRADERANRKLEERVSLLWRDK